MANVRTFHPQIPLIKEPIPFVLAGIYTRRGSVNILVDRNEFNNIELNRKPYALFDFTRGLQATEWMSRLQAIEQLNLEDANYVFRGKAVLDIPLEPWEEEY